MILATPRGIPTSCDCIVMLSGTKIAWWRYRKVKTSLQETHRISSNGFVIMTRVGEILSKRALILNMAPHCCSKLITMLQWFYYCKLCKSFNERTRSLIFLCRLERFDNQLFVNYFHTFIYYRSPMIKYGIGQLYTFNT